MSSAGPVAEAEAGLVGEETEDSGGSQATDPVLGLRLPGNPRLDREWEAPPNPQLGGGPQPARLTQRGKRRRGGSRAGCERKNWLTGGGDAPVARECGGWMGGSEATCAKGRAELPGHLGGIRGA